MVVFDFRQLCADVTHPPPLSRGEVQALFFFLVMRVLSVMFPLLRGDEGVCYGEKRGRG